MTVSVHQSIDHLPAALRARAEAAVQASVFRSPSWFAALERHPPGKGLEPRIYLAQSDCDDAFLILPLWADHRRRRLLALRSVYSLEYGPVSVGGEIGAQRDLLRAIARSIAAERPRWRLADIGDLPEDRCPFEALRQTFSDCGLAARRYDRAVNHYLSVAGQGFEDYYRQRPGRLRNTISRRERKLQSDHEVGIVISRELTEPLFADYRSVYGESWKTGEEQPELLENLYRLLSDRGLLRLGLLYCDRTPIATQMWIVGDGRATIYKLAYDARYRDFSPGSILSRAMFRSVIGEGGIREIDYGIGDEPYKRDWMDRRRALYGIEIFNLMSAGGRLLYLWSRLKDRLRPLLARRPART